MKNIASIRGLVNAIEYEVDRQIEILENGGIISNETRGYDGNLKKTVSMRDKEVKQDYRFMPEPNLPPLRLDLHGNNYGNPNILDVNFYKNNIPELPCETRKNISDSFGLNFDIVVRLVNEPDLLELFLDAQKYGPILSQDKLVHLLLLDVLHLCSKHFKPTKNCIKSEFLATASNMKVTDDISSALINKAFECEILGENYETFGELLSSKGWLSVFRNDEIIGELVTKVLKENPKVAKKYVKTGKVKFLQDLTQEVLVQNSLLDGAYVKDYISKELKK